MPARELLSRDARRLALGAGEIDYVLLRRRGRRGVALRVDAQGLTVSAPASVPLSRIEAFLRESERWIVGKIAHWSARRPPSPSWADGASLPYLGGALVLRTSIAGRSRVEMAGAELHVVVRTPGDEAVRRAVVAWYRRTALAYFTERVSTLARAGALPVPRVFVSSAARRWGSCNARREIRLAWRLLKAPPALIDHVVCHELAHLTHMNHSSAFWAEVERLCPDHRRLRRELEAADPLYRAF